MKKVKTYLLAIMFVIATALMGACSCGGPDIAVVDLKITAMSDNLVYNADTEEYMVMQGEKFTITYELLPSNATDTTVYVDVTPANRVDYTDFTVRAATKTVEFTAAKDNKGPVVISFTSKDGTKKSEVKLNIVSSSDLQKLTTPLNLRYDETEGKFVWDEITDASGEVENISGYQLLISTASGEEKFDITEKVNGKYPTEQKYNLENGVAYFARIKSVGKLTDKTYDSALSDSTKFYVLPSPTNLKSTRGVVSWDYGDKDNISGYKITFGNNQVVESLVAPETTQFDMAQYIKEKRLSLTTFNVQVQAVNSDFNPGKDDNGITSYVLSSRANPQIAITCIGAPEGLKYELVNPVNSVVGVTTLSWSAVTGANGYDIVIKKFGTETIVKNITGNVGTKLTLSDLATGKYTVTITAKGDDDKTIYGDQSKVESNFVVLPKLNGEVKYATNSLNLNLTELTSLIGTDNITNRLSYEVFTKTALSTYDRTDAKLIVNSGRTIDLTAFNYATPYKIMVRPTVKITETEKGAVTVDGTAFNVVAPAFSETDSSSADSISQLEPASVESIDVDGNLTFTDVNTVSIGEIYKYKFFLLKNGVTTEKTVENITVADGGLITAGEDNQKTIDLNKVFIGLLNDAGKYEVKVVPVSNLKIDASSSSVATRYFEFKRLSAVSSISIGDNNTISWTIVDGADHYLIKINDSAWSTTSDPSYEVTETLDTYNTVSIIAVGDNKTTLNSAVGEFKNLQKAESISNIRVEDGVLLWDGGVANSKYYLTISISGMEPMTTTLTERKFDGLSGISFAESATITIRHGIENGSDMAFNSETSTQIRLTRLNVVDIANSFAVVDNSNVVKFASVAGASGYRVILKKGGVVKNIKLTSDASLVDEDTLLFTLTTETVDEEQRQFVKFTLPELANGEYSISIQALPADQNAVENTDSETGEKYIEFKMISEVSGSASFVIYPEVTSINTSGKITWAFTQPRYLKDFVITFVDGEFANKTIVLSEYSFDFVSFLNGEVNTLIPAGTYTLSIQARADLANVVYATPTQFVVVKIATPVLSFKDNQITFKAIENAKSYEVYQNGEVMTSGYTLRVVPNEDGASDVVIDGLNIETGMEYTYTVRAIASEGFIDGAISDEIKLKMSSAPQNAVLSNGVITWDAVENNNGYLVVRGEDKVETDVSSFNLPALDEAGEYTFLVFTKGGNLVDGAYLLNSEALVVKVTKLSTATNMSLNGDIFTWGYEGASHPSKYELLLEYYDSENDTWIEVSLKNYTYVEEGDPSFELSEIVDYNGFKLKVKTFGNDDNFALDGDVEYFNGMINGVEKNENVFERVVSPVLSYQDGIVTLNENENYGSYEVYVLGDDGKYTILSPSKYAISDDLKLTLNGETGVNYTIKVRGIASGTSGKINSLLSGEMVISALPKVSDFRIERNLSSSEETSDYNGTFKWTSIPSAIGYKIYYKPNSESAFGVENFVYIDGGASNYYSFESIFLNKNLEQGKDYDFIIVALGGQTSGTPNVCYLNSVRSSLVTVRCVDSVSSLKLSDGLMSWSRVTGVNGYFVEFVQVVNESQTVIYSTTVTSTSLDLSDLKILTINTNFLARVTPVSTESNNFVIINSTGEEGSVGVKAKQIAFTRYSMIESVKVSDGLIKVTLYTPDSATLDAVKDLFDKYVAKAKDLEEGGEVVFDEDDLLNYIKYFGYLNLRVYPTGYAYESITPNKLINSVFDKTNNKIIYYYELGLKVPATTSLELKIRAVGNEFDDSGENNALPSFFTTLNVYKYSAPVKTKVDNLTTSDGYISFQRVVDGNGNYVTKYLLTATCSKAMVATDDETSATKMNIYTLYADIETSGIIGDDIATFVLLDASDLSRCYYTGKNQSFKYYYFNSKGEKMDWEQADGSTKLVNNVSYVFTLTTFGTADSDAETGDIYLRSNTYNTVEITYLYDYSAFGYKYDNNSTDGGYLTWNRNDKCLGYELYVVSRSVAEKYYGSATSQAKADSRWVFELEETKVYYISVEETTFMFYNTSDLEAGYYWCAIRPIGNGVDFITSPKTSNTVEVYKLNNVVNAKLQAGKFVWEVNEAELSGSKVIGFKVLLYTYQDGVADRTQVALPSLIGTRYFDGTQFTYNDYDPVTKTFHYEIPEEVLVSGIKVDFKCHNGERYGLGVIAIGGAVNNDQCVCSSVIDIVNSGRGYERLAQVTLKTNTESGYNQIEWNYTYDEELYKANTKSYTVFIEDEELSGTYDAYQLSNFVSGGTYNVSVRANASGGETDESGATTTAVYLSSLKSNYLKLVKYYNPKIVVKEGVIGWGNDQNGLNLVPDSSSIKVISEVTGEVVASDNHLDGDITTYELGNELPSGYYDVTINYNSSTEMEGEIPVYHIESQSSTIRVFKLATPIVNDVEILTGDGEGKIRETGFSGALQWNVVDNGAGQSLESYLVNILIKTGEDTSTLKNSIKFARNSSRVYVKTEANKDDEYESDFDTKYYFEYNTIDGKIYFNIGFDVLESLVGENIKGKTIILNIISLGNTVTNTSGSYNARVNSSIFIKTIDFTTTAPENDNSDTVNGILRWSGSENPVKITYTYLGEIKTVWLGSEYIKKYGKVYYLPHTSNVAYGKVTIEYILSNTFFSNPREIIFGTVNLFESGEGTDANPYIIKSRLTSGTASEIANDITTQFKNIKYRPTSVIKIDTSVTEIDLGSWTPINTFAGKLLGNASGRGSNVVVRNISFVKPTVSNNNTYTKISMFLELAESAEISDFTFAYNTNIENAGASAVANPIMISGIALDNYGVISNVVIAGSTDTKSYIRVYTQRDIMYGTIALNNYGVIKDGKVENTFYSVLKSSAVRQSYLYGGGIAYSNFNTIDNCVMSGSINAGADSSSNVKNRYVGGVAYLNNALILNSDFTGKISSWTMAGIAVYNNYIAGSGEAPYEVQLSKYIGGSTIEKTYVGGNILGCLSNGVFILSRGSTEDGFNIGGIAGQNNGAKIVRCYAKFDKGYTKETGVNENLDLDESAEKKGFVFTAFTNYGGKTLYSYIGGLVGISSVTMMGETAVYSSIENCYAEMLSTMSAVNESYIIKGALVGRYLFASGVAEDYNIKGNIYYSTVVSVPISGISSSTLQTVSLLSSSDIVNYVSEDAENNGLNSNTVDYTQVRKFVYDETLKLEI